MINFNYFFSEKSNNWFSKEFAKPILLTNKWHDHNNYVKYVPGIWEVVLPQSHQFQYTFGSEDGNEEYIDFVKDVSLRFTLLMSFHHHGDHVKADENHDDNVKGLSCYNVKKEPLVSVLEGKSTSGISYESREYSSIHVSNSSSFYVAKSLTYSEVREI